MSSTIIAMIAAIVTQPALAMLVIAVRMTLRPQMPVAGLEHGQLVYGR